MDSSLKIKSQLFSLKDTVDCPIFKFYTKFSKTKSCWKMDGLRSSKAKEKVSKREWEIIKNIEKEKGE